MKMWIVIGEMSLLATLLTFDLESHVQSQPHCVLSDAHGSLFRGSVIYLHIKIWIIRLLMSLLACIQTFDLENNVQGQLYYVHQMRKSQFIGGQ